MEQCPRCGHMTAETDHHTKILICYNWSCLCNHPNGTPYKEGEPFISGLERRDKKNIRREGWASNKQTKEKEE